MKRTIAVAGLILSLSMGSISTANAEIKTFACGSGTYKVEMPAGILKSSSGCTGEFVIDSTVKEIGGGAFYDGYGFGEGAKITSVVIPNSVTSIGGNAFRQTGITKLVIPNSVTSIGGWAFAKTESLKSAILSNSLTTMAYNIFEYSGLSEVIIPEGIKVIPFRTFAHTQLTSVVIPDSVTLIDQDAFWDSKLETVKFGKSLIKIGWGAFSSNNLVKIDIPDTVQEIWYSAFYGNKNLESITYCGPDIKNLDTSPTCPADRKAIVDAANAKAAAEKAAANKAAAEKAAAEKAAAEKAAADAEKAAADAVQAQQDAKQLTITCKKGSVTKKIRGESPKCPKGYVNPIGNLLTFKAFSECKLYKTDAPLRGASLINSGKTLIIENPLYSADPNALFYSPARITMSDVDCAFDYMGASERVRSSLWDVKPVKGVRTIRWGKITLRYSEDPLFGRTYEFRQS
jgi:hypothetical protein